MPRGRIVTFRNDRLGGRLMAMVNAMRLARVLDVDFAVHWHQSDDHARPFNDAADFFDPGFLRDHFIPREDFVALRAARLEEGSDPARLTAALSAGENRLVDRSIGLIALRGEHPADIAKAAAQIWAALPFAAPLQGRIAEIRNRIGAGGIAYHIRRGDVVSVPRAMNRPWPDKYIIDEIFERHIARSVDAGLRPILFSDDPGIVARLVARFPGTIAGAAMVPASGLGEGQRDLLELLAMSFCQRIVAPGNSAFSSTAATLGQGELIDIAHDLDEEEINAAHAGLVARLSTDMAGAVAESPGKLGQSLAHVTRRARDAGAPTQRQAADLTLAALRGGAGISFLWPQAADLFLRLGDHAALADLVEEAEGAEIYFPADLARLRSLAALSAAANGDPAGAARLALAALAEGSPRSPAADTASLFYATGVLTAANAPAFSPAARDLVALPPHRIADQPVLASLARTLDRDRHGRLALPDIQPLLWDWAPILRRLPPGALALHPRREKYQRRLDRLPQDDADTASLRAICDMHLGAGDWLARLRALGRAHPADAVVQMRLSHAALTAGEIPLMREAAERAFEAAPDSVGHLALRGLARLRSRDPAAALADLETAWSRGLALPLLARAAATAARRSSNPEGEGRFLDAALWLSPRNGAFLLDRAEYRERQGNTAGAKADHAAVQRLPIIPPRARLTAGQT